MSQAKQEQYKEALSFRTDAEKARWHDQAIWRVRESRDAAMRLVPDWEELRSQAAAIKLHTLSRLKDYLIEFEAQAQAAGAIVHWAANAREHNQIVERLLGERKIKRVLKSKSMLTEECELNEYLHARGIQVVESDLGEFAIQQAGEQPSHIVAPAIHKRKEEIAEVLERKVPGFSEYLQKHSGEASLEENTVRAVREHLRKEFLEAEAGITGVNFAVAESGTLVVCTNEGNADLGTSIPKLHIASMGIEKVIPRAEDLGVFLRLLARSATGQPITAYSSHFRGPREGGELHIIIVDNGRSTHLNQAEYMRSLSCIRCGACLNTCPVYRRSGGHSYGYAVVGPIGVILATLRDPETFRDLPEASTLCGSCSDVCPVKINLHEQILQLRSWTKAQVGGGKSFIESIAMHLVSRVMLLPGLFRPLANVGRKIILLIPLKSREKMLGAWAKERALPDFSKKSFFSEYRGKRGH